MNDVDNDFDAHAVCLIDQVFEVVWRALSGRNCEETGNMVAKTGVVGVLLNGHQLDHVVASFFDSGQGIICICPVIAHASSFMRHANVRFVDPVTRFPNWWDGVRMLPLVLLFSWWVPEDAVEEARISLEFPFGPHRISVHSALVRADNMQLVFHSVLDPWCSVWKSFNR